MAMPGDVIYDRNDPQVQAWEIAELVAHLQGHPERSGGDYCAHCYEEFQIRRDTLDIEGINLQDDYYAKMGFGEGDE